MKKKVSKRRVTKPSRTRSKNSSFSFQRLVIITACVLLVFGILSIKKNTITQSVAGISVMRGLFAQGSVEWAKNDIATTYNIYYREKGNVEFTNAVRHIPATVTNYTISYLKKGTSYEYKVSVADATGREYEWSEVKEITNLQPM